MRLRPPESPRDETWLEVALSDTKALLADHAHCERKAAATALSLVAKHPDRPDLVRSMIELAREELLHFEEVHAALLARGGTLPPDPGDPYARALVGLVSGQGDERLVDRLLVSALIEERSCQRLLLLGRRHPDPELAEMFLRFARAEANHGPLFLRLAREAAEDPGAVDARYARLAAEERRIVDEGPVRCAIH